MADPNHIVTVNIVTPDGVVYDHHGNLVIVNAIDGDIGIMASMNQLLHLLKFRRFVLNVPMIRIMKMPSLLTADSWSSAMI